MTHYIARDIVCGVVASGRDVVRVSRARSERMADEKDNGGAGWTAHNLTAPLSAMAKAAQPDATRQQVRLVASALGIEVSEFEASKHAETLLALVEAEEASGIATFAVTAHLLDSRAAAHNAAMIARLEKNNALTERIAVALEKMTGVRDA